MLAAIIVSLQSPPFERRIAEANIVRAAFRNEGHNSAKRSVFREATVFHNGRIVAITRRSF